MRQRPGWTITDESPDEPLTLDEVKTFLRQDDFEDDALIGVIVKAARLHVERVTNRSLVRKTVKATFDRWPEGGVRASSTQLVSPSYGKLELPLASPLLEVDRIEYVDLDGSTQTLASSIYTVVTDKLPGRVRLSRNQAWPDVVDDEGVITITYDVGYGAAADVPEDVKAAIYFLVAHWYDNREAVDVSIGGTVTRVPNGFDALVSGLKVPRVH